MYRDMEWYASMQHACDVICVSVIICVYLHVYIYIYGPNHHYSFNSSHQLVNWETTSTCPTLPRSRCGPTCKLIWKLKNNGIHQNLKDLISQLGQTFKLKMKPHIMTYTHMSCCSRISSTMISYNELPILLMEEILHQLSLVVYSSIYRIFYIPGGDRRISEPSTVLPISSSPFIYWIRFKIHQNPRDVHQSPDAKISLGDRALVQDMSSLMPPAVPNDVNVQLWTWTKYVFNRFRMSLYPPPQSKNYLEKLLCWYRHFCWNGQQSDGLPAMSCIISFQACNTHRVFSGVIPRDMIEKLKH